MMKNRKQPHLTTLELDQNSPLEQHKLKEKKHHKQKYSKYYNSVRSHLDSNVRQVIIPLFYFDLSKNVT